MAFPYRRNSHEVNPDDEEIEADSWSVPSFRRMPVPYPDEGAIKTQHMSPPSLGYGPAETHQQHNYQKSAIHPSAGPPKDPWGPSPTPAAPQPAFDSRSFAMNQMFGASPLSEPTVNSGKPSEDSEEAAICAERFPSTYRLERTNFAVTSSRFSGDDIEVLVNALKLAFVRAGIDVVEFRPSECTFKCSYQKGSLFLSFMVTVFRAPSQASGLLLGSHDEDGLILVEVQLREGDGLYFSGLFRDLVDIVNTEEGVTIAGTLRYHPCPNHPYGEGLALEGIMMKPSGHGPAPSGFPFKPMGAGGGYPGDAADEKPEELDEDMTEDVMLLSGMIREGFPTVQADAASVVAGLTSTDAFRQQLSMDGASSAALALASASARLLVETPNRAARRQASVVVANLAFDPVLRAALLASDGCSSKGTAAGSSTSSSAGGGKGVGVGAQAQAEAFSRGLLDSLVLFAVGGITTTTTSQSVRGGGAGRIGEEKAGADEEEQEEEIGMRRECMRALLGMSESEEARDTKAMKSLLLLTAEPTGQGATDKVLIDQLAACQNVLKGHA